MDLNCFMFPTPSLLSFLLVLQYLNVTTTLCIHRKVCWSCPESWGSWRKCITSVISGLLVTIHSQSRVCWLASAPNLSLHPRPHLLPWTTAETVQHRLNLHPWEQLHRHKWSSLLTSRQQALWASPVFLLRMFRFLVLPPCQTSPVKHPTVLCLQAWGEDTQEYEWMLWEEEAFWGKSHPTPSFLPLEGEEVSFSTYHPLRSPERVPGMLNLRVVWKWLLHKIKCLSLASVKVSRLKMFVVWVEKNQHQLLSPAHFPWTNHSGLSDIWSRHHKTFNDVLQVFVL